MFANMFASAFSPACTYCKYVFWSEGCLIKFFFRPCGHAASNWPKSVAVAKFYFEIAALKNHVDTFRFFSVNACSHGYNI